MEVNKLTEIKDVTTAQCRFCGKNKNVKNLIKLFHEEKGEHIISLINYFNMTYVDMSQEDRSKFICGTCYNFIIEAYSFFEKVKQTQINFIEMNIIKVETLHEEVKVEAYKSDGDSYLPGFNEPLIYEIKNCVDNNQSVEVIQKICPKRNLRSKQNVNNIVKAYPTRESNNVENKHTEDEKDIKLLVDNWTTYPWICMHCKIECDTMDELRSHSKKIHKICYGFSCADCKKKFNNFDAFISHVIDHREVLRYYCQYCNQKFECPKECYSHVKLHKDDRKMICNWCGEIFADIKLFEWHNMQYNRSTIKKKKKNTKCMNKLGLQNNGTQSSWIDYGWACQVCGEGFPDVTTLRKHVHEVHQKCFAMKCMDCPAWSKSFTKFITHVERHRPYLKQYCAYCNKKINNKQQLATHTKRHFAGTQKPCYGCGHVFENNDIRRQHMKTFMTPRPTHEIDPEDLVCNICQKKCNTLAKLKLHKETHNANRTRNFTCDTCGKAFFNLGTLKGHLALHYEKTQMCKICPKSFYSKSQLKQHVKIHLQLIQMECDYCGRIFSSKSKLVAHIHIHLGFRPHKCSICHKSFTLANDLKSHSYIHTGFRPYSCKVCGKGFTNWGNCNKHMISNHGILMGKKKLLSKENVDSLDKGTKEWVDALIKNKKGNVI